MWVAHVPELRTYVQLKEKEIQTLFLFAMELIRFYNVTEFEKKIVLM